MTNKHGGRPCQNMILALTAFSFLFFFEVHGTNGEMKFLQIKYTLHEHLTFDAAFAFDPASSFFYR